MTQRTSPQGTVRTSESLHRTLAGENRQELSFTPPFKPSHVEVAIPSDLAYSPTALPAFERP
jgi:hypothetical protein